MIRRVLTRLQCQILGHVDTPHGLVCVNCKRSPSLRLRRVLTLTYSLEQAFIESGRTSREMAYNLARTEAVFRRWATVDKSIQPEPNYLEQHQHLAKDKHQ